MMCPLLYLKIHDSLFLEVDHPTGRVLSYNPSGNIRIRTANESRVRMRLLKTNEFETDPLKF